VIRAFACLLIFASFLTLNAGDRVRVACVGDSITFGATIKGRAKNAYPIQLGAILGDGYDVRNFGQNGRTLLKNGDKPYWKSGVFREAKAFNPNIVVIMLGTNDTKPQNWKYKDEFLGNYIELVEIFQKLPSHPQVWVVLPVPAFPGRWGITDKVIKNELIPLIRRVAEKTGAKLIDAYSALAGQKSLFSGDGVHPNKEGAAVLAKTIAKAISKQKETTAKGAPTTGGK